VNLLDLTKQVHQIDPELTVYAKAPWSFDSEVCLAIEPEDSLIPESLASQGFSYFLEVFIASEVVPDLSSGVPFFTQKKWCERLIRYAEMDS